MPKLIFSIRFEKKLRGFIKKHPELTEIIKQKLLILQENPRDPRLKIHKLTGKLKSLFAVSITYEYRVIFDLEDDSIFLLAIGTHDEVY